jgi:hypothetical protein
MKILTEAVEEARAEQALSAPSYEEIKRSKEILKEILNAI